jgi:hypothetical protein
LDLGASLVTGTCCSHGGVGPAEGRAEVHSSAVTPPPSTTTDVIDVALHDRDGDRRIALVEPRRAHPAVMDPTDDSRSNTVGADQFNVVPTQKPRDEDSLLASLHSSYTASAARRRFSQ